VAEENINRRSSIELRHLRYFVALAEELSFRKTAERLHITQPSLSHQIALLERMLGVRLFQRDRRQVALTDAGKAILDDVRELLAESDAVVLKAQRIAEADWATLRVGLPEYANRTLIPDIVSAFRRRHPELKVVLQEGYSRALLPELRAGRLDVAFMRIPAALDTADLMVEPIIDEEPGLLVAAHHRLATCREILVGSLAGEQILIVDRQVNPALYDEVALWLERAGVQPRFFKIGGTGVYTYDTMLRVIESGEAVSLSTPTMAGDLPPGVLLRPISGRAPHFQVAAVWSPTNTSSRVRSFLELARELRDAGAAALAS
jgi:DNA-binding transcriptional LysR family regulator